MSWQCFRLEDDVLLKFWQIFVFKRKDLEEVLADLNRRYNAHAQRNIFQRGFFTLNKLKTHIADRKQFQIVRGTIYYKNYRLSTKERTLSIPFKVAFSAKSTCLLSLTPYLAVNEECGKRCAECELMKEY